MIDREVNPLRIICETRYLKQGISASLAEILFILKSDALTREEIAVWFVIVSLTYSEPKFSCTLSFQQLAEMTDIPIYRISAVLTKLQHMGFLLLEINNELTQANCTLHFPLEGLLFLKKTPKIREDKSNEFFYEWGLRKRKPEIVILGRAKQPTIPKKKKEGLWQILLGLFLS